MQSNTRNFSRIMSIIVITVLVTLAAFMVVVKPFEKKEIKGTQIQQQEAQASLKIGNINYQMDFLTGDSLLNAMEQLKNNSQDFTIETKKYEFGVMVTSINGITPSPTQFWKLKINDKDSSEGVSDYKLQSNDKIEFTLEKTNF